MILAVALRVAFVDEEFLEPMDVLFHCQQYVSCRHVTDFMTFRGFMRHCSVVML